MADQKRLRDEIRMLGDLLGDILRAQAGQPAFDLVEDVRALAKSRRAGHKDAEAALIKRIRSLNVSQLSNLIHALSVFFDLANLAEDRHRVRVLRQRKRNNDHADAQQESLAAVVAGFKKASLKKEQVEALIQRLHVELVFTAHPTEAKRRSIREKVRDLREHLHELDRRDLLPDEREQLLNRLRADVTGLWQTDFVRFRRPTVLEELDRSLFFAGNLWNVTPQLYRDLRDALHAQYPKQHFALPTLLRFGTWIGGDRDGNPFVTADVTRSALHTLRASALKRHIEQAKRTRRHLSMSKNKVRISKQLTDAIAYAENRWPQLQSIVGNLSELEPYRRWIKIIEWRLARAAEADLITALPAGAYENSGEFVNDLRLIDTSLRDNGDALIADVHLDDWICQAEVFGFHLMRLDVRQESTWYHQVLDELLRSAQIHDNYASLDEAGRQRALSDSMPCRSAFNKTKLSEQAREALALFRLLASVSAMSGADALGAHVISMTHAPSDVLAVLWLAQWAAAERGLKDNRLPMPIAPLFETIDDLKRAPQTLRAMLENHAYSAHVDALSGKQIVMIGYSDSTKDGGYLSACWNLYDAQIAMHQAVAERGRTIVFFHGRGGSLGRGGGPANRSIRSLPPHTLDGGMRITEQGEVLSERYDDPHVAHRHLEQVLSALLQRGVDDVGGRGARAIEKHDALREIMSTLAARSREVYRELVDHPGFIRYFEGATPISQIEQLPIGSRPSRRQGERSLDKLRAIPWVFSWTQSRHMLPAWYGIGTAIEEYLQSGGDKRLQSLRSLYKKQLFFRATINNAALALAKADLGIARLHASMVEDVEAREAIWSRIEAEFERSRRTMLALLDQRKLLGDVPWLKRSIEVRNPYVDPLNMIQLELFRRLRAMPDDDPRAEEIASLVRLTIQGIAGGLRTTG